MQVAILRWVDFWVGIPLCFLCSGINRLFPRKPRPVRKILVIKLSELGAIILSYPLLKKLKSQYPEAEIHALTFSKNKDVFAFLDNIVLPEHIICVDDGSPRSLAQGFFHTFKVFRREEFDIVVDLEFYARAGALLSFLTLAPIRVGFYPYGFEGLYRGNMLTHRVLYNPLKHVSVNFYALSMALSLPEKKSPEYDVHFDESDFTFPLYALGGTKNIFSLPENKKIVLMNAGEGVLPLREWPLENFADVAKSILEDKESIIVLVGTESAQSKSNQLEQILNDPRVMNLSGKTSIRELMDLFALSRMVIANDCGLMHLAMLTNIEKIVFFGPETPRVFGPLGKNTHVFYSHWPCSPCLSVLNHRQSSCRDNQCLKAISPWMVIERTKQILAKVDP